MAFRLAIIVAVLFTSQSGHACEEHQKVSEVKDQVMVTRYLDSGEKEILKLACRSKTNCLLEFFKNGKTKKSKPISFEKFKQINQRFVKDIESTGERSPANESNAPLVLEWDAVSSSKASQGFVLKNSESMVKTIDIISELEAELWLELK